MRGSINQGRTRRVRARLGLAATAAATLAVIATAAGPAAGTPPTLTIGPWPPDAGALRLHLGATDYVRYDAADGAGGYTAGTAETLSVAGCVLAAPLPTSLRFTPEPDGGSRQGKVGLASDAIGVQVKGEGNGTPCGQVNGTGQALVLTLGGSLSGLSMDYAELDVEGKYGATVRAELYRGSTLVRTELLATGGPDSGPDSADNDNYRWRVPAASAGLVVFDKIRLSVDASTPSGAFSLEGGADGTTPEPGGLAATKLGGTGDSVFHVITVDGVLGCGQSATEGGGSDPTATITLVDGPSCTAVPYNLQVGDGTILFQKDTETGNSFRATFVWEVEAGSYPAPPTEVNYGDGAGTHPMAQCDGTPAAPVVPTGEHWCIIDTFATIAGTDLMQVTEHYFGDGDPIFGR